MAEKRSVIVTIVAVVSLDGKITNWKEGDVSSWASPEDQKHFAHLRKSADAIIMGSSTYDDVKDSLVLSKDTIRVVMTSDMTRYQDDQVEGMLHFQSDAPSKIIDLLVADHRRKILVLGGGMIFYSFLSSGLIDDMYVTVEPLLFGEGRPFIDGRVHVKLKQVSAEKLNERGTLLLHYKVEDNSVDS